MIDGRRLVRLVTGAVAVALVCLGLPGLPALASDPPAASPDALPVQGSKREKAVQLR